MSLRDVDIRYPLHEWLLEAHAPVDDTVIIHELQIPRPSARVDMAVVNGEICGFEIKSDVDGLSRLPRQVRAFNAVFDRVTIVTTRKHVTNATKLVPRWWGILVSDAADGFCYEQQSLENPDRDVRALLHIFSRAELCEILTAHKLSRGLKSKRKSVLVTEIADLLTTDELLFAARHTLKRRYRFQPPSSSSYC